MTDLTVTVKLEKAVLNILYKILEETMANKQLLEDLSTQLGTAITNIGAGIDGVRGDVTELKAKIEELEAAVDAGEDLTDVIADLKSKADDLDAKSAALAELDSETDNPPPVTAKKKVKKK